VEYRLHGSILRFYVYCCADGVFLSALVFALTNALEVLNHRQERKQHTD